ncbi:MAG: ribonuclease Y [Parcubacteria group bacterium CG08_land_8_20_14_0_20_48_21]|nr:MAG: ribonuclease Y [Parcubacteria group bacterium CG2_30_48_51]PIS32681.1 MAG: ribonuclease Y [Parcubacteria group bacterium CG08_land_8_20_14_0_20_48_21]PIW79022.1 MAG: ribonuclease Y [Parcubacteria group bacterium CG_4_8_14_3_um_filter_48_16]PIY77959.1 MAG: ribonuclease Y [Parcubacteria group bacterium CG_4_10_14_0_8_um_filter_48_154]PIZ77561.1 MAG: ribonuclease Y [bacterium CG_4_10_14_0_2_um_filter_48_144]PJC39671.1 MAG: ribonuclease Y [Parcubacteria group bacterium CG_4_9_14_0_2_um_fil
MPATFVFLIGGITIGLLFGFLLRKMIVQNKIETAANKAEQILIDAKNREKDLLLKAKERALAFIDEAKQEEAARRKELRVLQQRLEQREGAFSKKLLELQDKQQKLYDKVQQVEQIKGDIEDVKNQTVKKLEEVAHLTREEAEQRLLVQVEESAQENLLTRMRKLEAQSQEELQHKGLEILVNVIERCATNHVSEFTTTVVDLPNDEMKGRIIGREGRNIRAIEHLTGVELIVDDTPGVITVSGFSPIRRQIAKRALDSLIKDGRIHPGRIEEAIETAKKEIALDVKKAGEDALYKLGIPPQDPKLTQILGRLKYRTSYGQNQLKHSMEVAMLAEMLAKEVGANVQVCKKGGLFHDIGKAIDHEVQGGHPEIGYDLMKKFGMPEEIAYQSIAHHEDHPKTLEGIVVKIADAISGSRPGARRDSQEQYIQRLEELEGIAQGFTGVEKVYAIQAGREVRVFVTPQQVTDMQAQQLAKNIATQIEKDMQYPGEIKVNVIRETRVIEYAR